MLVDLQGKKIPLVTVLTNFSLSRGAFQGMGRNLIKTTCLQHMYFAMMIGSIEGQKDNIDLKKMSILVLPRTILHYAHKLIHSTIPRNLNFAMLSCSNNFNLGS